MSEADPYSPPSGPSTPRTKKTAFVLASDLIWLVDSVVVLATYRGIDGTLYAKVRGGDTWLPDVHEGQHIPLVRFTVEYGDPPHVGVTACLPYERMPDSVRQCVKWSVLPPKHPHAIEEP